MGAADVVPGVSGGTMALILGIYTQLLTAIRSFDKIWLQHVLKLEIKPIVQRPHFSFLIPLAIGILCALLFFTRVISLPTLLHTQPELVYGFFFGLVVGSIITLLLEVSKGINWLLVPLLLLGTIIGWFIVTLVPVDTPEATWFIFLSGVLAISAMLLPGISGSFILLILHKYDTILNGLGHFNWLIILPFGLGALTGLIIFSRLLSWLLTRYYYYTLTVITGLLIGTLWIIWPFQFRHYITLHDKIRLISATPYFPDTLSTLVMQSTGMALIGLIVILAIHWMATYGKRS